MQQLRIDFGRRVRPKPGETIEERFEAFHAANPHVAETLAQMALELRRRGWKRYGIAALWEVLRFQRAMQTDSNEPYKLNNDFRALYARLLMQQYPELDGFFEIRARRVL